MFSLNARKLGPETFANFLTIIVNCFCRMSAEKKQSSLLLFFIFHASSDEKSTKEPVLMPVSEFDLRDKKLRKTDLVKLSSVDRKVQLLNSK